MFFSWFESIRVDPSRSELIWVDPTRTGGPSWSGPTFVPALATALRPCEAFLWLKYYEPIVMNENIIHALKHIIIINTNWRFDVTN